MLIPSIFGESLLDGFVNDFAFPYTSPKKVYGKEAAPLMRTDVKETKVGYELEIELPGVKKEDVKAELKDGYLTIKAERKNDEEETDKKGRVIRSERFMGTCQRTFYVGDHVKKEDVAAAYEDGVLKLNVPKKVETLKVEESHLIDIQ